MKKKVLLLSFVFLFILAGVTSICFAGEFKAFSKEYIRGAGAPETVTNDFKIDNPNIIYLLRIFNSGLVDYGNELVSASEILINGHSVVDNRNLNQNVINFESVLDALLTYGTNEINVEVRGKPGGVLTVQIIGVCTDNDNDGFNIEGDSCGLVDCDDTKENVNPDAEEVYNWIDDNCNTQIDEGLELIIDTIAGVIIGPSGGKALSPDPDSPIYGVELEVPAYVLSSETTIKISAVDVPPLPTYLSPYIEPLNPIGIKISTDTTIRFSERSDSGSEIIIFHSPSFSQLCKFQKNK